MKALTLIRPWCWAIMHAGKDVENRVWRPPPGVVGKFIAIHSGASFDVDAATFIQEVMLDGGAAEFDFNDEEWPGKRIVGVARVASVIGGGQPEPPYPLNLHLLSDWYNPPQFGWVLNSVIALDEPVECLGAQKLWTVAPGTADKVMDALPAGKKIPFAEWA